MNKYLGNINLSEKIDLSKIDWNDLLENLKNPTYKNIIEDYPSVYWPEIFDTKDLTGRSDAQLCAYGLMAWGHCYMGCKIHPNFGEVMVMIGKRLGINPLVENLSEWSKNFLKEKKNGEQLEIKPINRPCSCRTGGLTKTSVEEINVVLGFPPNIKDDPDKVKHSWGFTVNGVTCGIWDYKGSEEQGVFSTYGSDDVFTKLFGDKYNR